MCLIVAKLGKWSVLDSQGVFKQGMFEAKFKFKILDWSVYETPRHVLCMGYGTKVTVKAYWPLVSYCNY